MTDQSDYFRAYARDVGVNPLLNGADNVQDAIANVTGAPTGTLVHTAYQDLVVSDAPVTVPCDGASHTIAVVAASRPAWLDGAGHVLQAGQYQEFVQFGAGVAPTTPGLSIVVEFGIAQVPVPLDALTVGDLVVLGDVFNLDTGDLPATVPVVCLTPTDVTGTVAATAGINRLATFTT